MRESRKAEKERAGMAKADLSGVAEERKAEDLSGRAETELLLPRSCLRQSGSIYRSLPRFPTRGRPVYPLGKPCMAAPSGRASG